MNLVIGAIGHVDHGKTALVRALTGQETDRLAEEKRRGISIALGFAHIAGPGAAVDVIDMPGHERFVRTMIAGATGLDAVLLVVAANEGVKAQTVEHVEIAALLGIERAVLAVTKIDLCGAERVREVAAEAKALLARCGVSVAARVSTSVQNGAGIAELRGMLQALAATQRPRADGVAFLPIDRAFSIAGHGPVVTGTLRGAAVAEGDRLQLLPSRAIVRVRAAQVRSVTAARAEPGQRVALNLRDVDLSQLKQSVALAAPDTLSPSQWITISLRSFADAPSLANGAALRAFVGTQEIGVRLRLLDRDVLEPGRAGFAQLRCAEPIAIPAREHVILRLASPAQTVAGGRILDPEAQRCRRNCAANLRQLEDRRDLPAPQAIAAEVARAGLAGISLQRLARLAALSPLRLAGIVGTLPVTIIASSWAAPAAEMEALLARIPDLLTSAPAGLSRGALAATLPEVGANVLDEALAHLLTRGAISLRGARYAIAAPAADRRRADEDAALAARLAAALLQAGLCPPRPREIAGDAAEPAVRRLLQAGALVRAIDPDKGKEVVFHREAIEAAKRQLAPLLVEPPGLLVTEIGAALRISRKYCMPLLNHLDAIKFTRRVRDRRVLGAKSSPVRSVLD